MQYGNREAAENLKEQRIQYFLEHYHSKQEVLYRLPLNIPISSFWPELLNRRRAKATVLPLHNAGGMPYWFVLTEKMVAASDRLSQEAVTFSGNKDPYQMKMTAAMTKEMYFTSFVEGANMQIEEAMEFLNRGTSPENIMEQMIWNNRKAWELMVKNLYSPINEESVRFLAYVLTDGMDQCAENYRQNDQHPIVAMQGEDYEIPMAAQIPGLMSEYYAFMNNPEIHPLIKAPVGAAFLLVTRPFPEGNERLSRLISSMVLLRGGYGFYQDISLSAVIAKETWFYYQSLCEILRSHNEGDLTYFMEYFLEMLVRAVDQKKEQDQHMKEETVKDLIGREQQMARAPLETATVTVLDRPGLPDPGGGTIHPEMGNPSWLLRYLSVIDEMEIKNPASYDFSAEVQAISIWLENLKGDLLTSEMKERFLIFLRTGSIRAIRMTAFIISWIADKKTDFSAKDYRGLLHVGENMCYRDVQKAKKYGLIKDQGTNNKMQYMILKEPGLIVDSLKQDVFFHGIKPEIVNASRRQKELLYNLEEQFGMDEFTAKDASEALNLKIKTINFHFKRMSDKGLLCKRQNGNHHIYSLPSSASESNPEPKCQKILKLTDHGMQIMKNLYEEYGTTTFYVIDASQRLHTSKDVLYYQLRKMMQLDLLQRERGDGHDLYWLLGKGVELLEKSGMIEQKKPEEDAERIREHLANKHRLSGACLMETAVAG